MTIRSATSDTASWAPPWNGSNCAGDGPRRRYPIQPLAQSKRRPKWRISDRSMTTPPTAPARATACPRAPTRVGATTPWLTRWLQLRGKIRIPRGLSYADDDGHHQRWHSPQLESTLTSVPAGTCSAALVSDLLVRRRRRRPGYGRALQQHWDARSTRSGASMHQKRSSDGWPPTWRWFRPATGGFTGSAICARWRLTLRGNVEHAAAPAIASRRVHRLPRMLDTAASAPLITFDGAALRCSMAASVWTLRCDTIFSTDLAADESARAHRALAAPQRFWPGIQ